MSEQPSVKPRDDGETPDSTLADVFDVIQKSRAYIVACVTPEGLVASTGWGTTVERMGLSSIAAANTMAKFPAFREAVEVARKTPSRK